MWIIPSNLPVSFVSAQDFLDLNAEPKEPLEKYELSLTWKSKPLSWPTLLRAWKRVWWIPLLFGRMLKLSTKSQNTFAEKYMASWADIRVKASRLLAKEKAQKTQDTFGRLYHELSKQQDLFGAGLKMSAHTLAWDTKLFTKTYEKWVTRLRQESLQRRKLVRLMKENAYSYWPSPNASSAVQGENLPDGRRGQTLVGAARGQNWGTPRVSTNGMTGTNPQNPNYRLEDMVISKQNQWSTPTTSRGEYQYVNRGKDGTPKAIALKLEGQVKQKWPTPIIRETVDNNFKGRKGKRGVPNLATMIAKWHTPMVQDSRNSGTMESRMNRTTIELATQVQQNWQTPTVQDALNIAAPSQVRRNSLPLNTQVIIGRQGPDARNMIGSSHELHSHLYACQILYEKYGITAGRVLRKCWERKNGRKLTLNQKPQLSPAWVAQLQGTTLERTFFVPMAIR